jgi:hypothetical protein
MDKQVINPLTGRLISTTGTTYKQLLKKDAKATTLQAIFRRIAIKKSKPKKFGYEDLPEDIKALISKNVKANINEFDNDYPSPGGVGYLHISDYINFVNLVLSDNNIGYAERVKLKEDALELIKQEDYGVMTEVDGFTRKEQAYFKRLFKSDDIMIKTDLGTENSFILNASDFHYDLAGGYGGDGYNVFTDGRYWGAEEEMRDDDTFNLFGNPKLIVKKTKVTYKSGNSTEDWVEPKYNRFEIKTEKDEKEYQQWISDNFKDYNLSKKEQRDVKDIKKEGESSSEEEEESSEEEDSDSD